MRNPYEVTYVACRLKYQLPNFLLGKNAPTDLF